MQSGIETVLDLIGFDELLNGADLVVTGEGRADFQSCCGKVMQGVGLRAKAKGIPAIGLCGSVADGADKLYDCGIAALYSLVDEHISLQEAISNAERVYYNSAVGMFRALNGLEPFACLWRA